MIYKYVLQDMMIVLKNKQKMVRLAIALGQLEIINVYVETHLVQKLTQVELH